MKTKVRVKQGNYSHNNFKAGDEGYIDGYVRDAYDVPMAVVVFPKNIVLIPIFNLEPI